MSFFALLLLSTLSMAAPFEVQEAWTGISDPLIMSNNFETRLYLLPEQADVTHPNRFWSGDYWAMKKNNINYRWNADRGFNRSSPSQAELAQMTEDEKSQLSPAEKFDLLNGRYDYPLKAEVEQLTSYNSKSWEGICHGWAPATMNHPEPKPRTLLNPQGISIPFGSADIKAILSYYYAYPYQVANTHQMGRRCERAIFGGDDCRQDLNAGAFHIILTNRIAFQNEGFVADMDRFKQVWNHPISGYKMKALNEAEADRQSAPGTVRRVRYSTTITYADESVNTWEPLLGTRDQKTKTQEMNYYVELNIRGEIIGGEWTSIFRPDFIWIKEAPVSFHGDYARLNELVD